MIDDAQIADGITFASACRAIAKALTRNDAQGMSARVRAQIGIVLVECARAVLSRGATPHSLVDAIRAHRKRARETNHGEAGP